MIFSCEATAFANEVNDESSLATNDPCPYSIEIEDELLDNATVISEQTYVKEGRAVNIIEYQTDDGKVIVDSLEYPITPMSKNGNDTVTRTRDLGDYGKITVTAKFRWYTDSSAGIGGVSYVRCESMTTKHTGKDKNVVVRTWNEDYSSSYKAFGIAYAKLEYYMYYKDIPVKYQSGTIKITCDDTGSISDNA